MHFLDESKPFQIKCTAENPFPQESIRNRKILRSFVIANTLRINFFYKKKVYKAQFYKGKCFCW